MSVNILSLADARVVNLHIRVEDEDWHDESGNLLYTHFIVERSVLTKDGPFADLNARYWEPAVIPEDAGTPSVGTGPLANLDGKTLELRIDGTIDLVVTFSGVDPMTYLDASVQIAAALGNYGISYVDEDNRLVIATARMGTGARLEIVGGEAAPALGLDVGSAGCGKDPYVHLVPGKPDYSFRDLFGNSAFWYRIRFFDQVTGAESEPTSVMQAGDVRTVSPEELALGQLRLITQDGRPVYNAHVTVQAIDSGVKGDAIVAGRQIEGRTDKEGRVSFWLLRGYKVRVTVPDLGMHREVVVPDSDSFALLDPTLAPDDLFAPKRLDIVYAHRVDNRRNR